MTRINALRNITGTSKSVAWGEKFQAYHVVSAAWGNINALVFAAVLIVCSVSVGCSSEKPKPVSSNKQIPVPQPQMAPTPPPATAQAVSKPAPKKAVVRKIATVNYTDKTYGVTFEYPRRYAIETGDAATDLVLSNPIPMNFVQPGGVALAAVELPETGFANTDFSSAFFNVSVNKNLTADQCADFAVPQPKEVVTSEIKTDATPAETSKQDATTAVKSEIQGASVSPVCHPEDGTSCSPKDLTTSSVITGAAGNSASNANSSDSAQHNKLMLGELMLGNLELRGIEAVSGEGTRQSDSKYFHVFQNGACYEFALNVTTDASDEGLVKHVDRDKVFERLEKILATVKISPVTPDVTADGPATPVVPAAPAQ